MGRSTVYNNNLTEDWEKVSKENRTLVQDFIKYLKSNDKSPQTIHQYEEWLKVFFCWNYKENGDTFFVNLKKRDFVYYFGWCRDLNMSPNRIAALKSVLSSLSSEIELLYEDEYPTFRNQLRGLEPIHITTVREKTVISSEELDEILDMLEEKGMYQEACYLALGCASGSRKAELLQMKVSFFKSEDAKVLYDGYMYLTPKIRTKGRGKVGKQLSKYVIKPMFDKYLNLWLEEREKKGINTDSLFVSKEKGTYVPATVTTANGFVRNISKISKREIYSHSLRHYFCGLLKRMELPDDVIVTIFGWESASMLKIYDDTPQEERLAKWFEGMKKSEAEGE